METPLWRYDNFRKEQQYHDQTKKVTHLYAELQLVASDSFLTSKSLANMDI